MNRYGLVLLGAMWFTGLSGILPYVHTEVTVSNSPFPIFFILLSISTAIGLGVWLEE